MKTTKKGGVGALVLILGTILFGAIIVGTCLLAGKYYDTTEVTFTVTEKELMDRDGNGARYLVWSEDETFENVDSILKGKFNSSDLYGQLKVGNTYTCEVYGWRNSFFSYYRNLVKCKEVRE